MITVNLCMMVVLVELYLFIPLSVTLTVFQDQISVKHFQLKILSSYSIKLILCMIVDYVR